MTEDDRQEAIARYSLGDVGTEPAFNSITELAADMFGVPIALVTVLTLERQLFRGACGLSGEGTPRVVAFCDHSVRQPGVMVIGDARQDSRFVNNPLVLDEPNIRFYAGAPLRVGDGVAIGSLCLIDRVPRSFGPHESKRLEMLAKTVVDIIELRAGSLLAAERERTLVRQAQLLKDTVENVNQGIAVFGPDFRLILWNQSFFDLFDFPAELANEGVPAAELVGITAARGELGPGEPATIVSEFLEGALVTKSGQREIIRISGQILDIHRNRMSNGNFILAATDVTSERKLAEIKNEFISTVNHELRTPLTSILGSLSLLKAGHAGAMEPKAERLIEMAHQNGQRLNALINDLLDIEKISTGGLELRLVPVELGALLEKALDQNFAYADRFAIDLKVELSDIPVRVNADENRLLQALANLISNAVKFSPAGETVRLSLTTDAKNATISVADKGRGIAPDFADQIFGRFAQADPGDVRTKGTGLGLAITKSLVEQHRGRIRYETEQGKGTTFWIDLPLLPEDIR